ncbi:MAG: hypothetical protein WC856_07780 [Methylococcaceae bacterium]|jgi:hypothetical protein
MKEVFIDGEEYVLKQECEECKKFKHQRFEGEAQLVERLLQLEADNKNLWTRNNYLETLISLEEVK